MQSAVRQRTLLMNGTPVPVPALAVGCMRVADKTPEEMAEFIHASLDLGLNFFDHADIYAGGRSEALFGEALASDASLRREDLIIQTKCGICRGYFDFSARHILEAVDGSLQRLRTDYLDILLLHRPDALMEPEEVAEAFDALAASGKVRAFGVSNQKPAQMELLQRNLTQPLVVNQLQFSLPVSNMVASGLEVNMETPGSFDHDGSILDYCRLKGIMIQAWSPFQMPAWRGPFIGAPEYAELNAALEEIAGGYGVTPTAIAAAWILRHPAGMQVVTGTASIQRLREIRTAESVCLTRPEWYRLYLAAGHILP